MFLSLLWVCLSWLIPCWSHVHPHRTVKGKEQGGGVTVTLPEAQG